VDALPAVSYSQRRGNTICLYFYGYNGRIMHITTSSACHRLRKAAGHLPASVGSRPLED